MEPHDGVPARPESRPNGAWARLLLGTRRDIPELLDDGDLAASDVAANLADLARLNRLPGGAAASTSAIRALANGAAPDLRILDVGTGGADLPLDFARRGWRSVAVDHNPRVLDVARRATDAVADAVEIVEADGRSLPFPDASFDVAHCSLVLHHLDEAQAVRVLGELRRVARHGVVVNDLRRGPFAFVATALPTLALSRSRVTRHDGIASARRAYTLDELDRLLAEAGLRSVWRSARWLPRVATAAVAW